MRVDATGCGVTEEGAWRDIDSSELRMFSVVAETVGDHIGVDGSFEDGFTKRGHKPFLFIDQLSYEGSGVGRDFPPIGSFRSPS